MKVTAAELASILRGVAGLVLAGDSFEGSINYHLSGPDSWEVHGAYRFGNTDGQGCMRLIKASEPATPDAIGDTTAPYGTVVVDDPDAPGCSDPGCQRERSHAGLHVSRTWDAQAGLEIVDEWGDAPPAGGP